MRDPPMSQSPLTAGLFLPTHYYDIIEEGKVVAIPSNSGSLPSER